MGYYCNCTVPRGILNERNTVTISSLGCGRHALVDWGNGCCRYPGVIRKLGALSGAGRRRTIAVGAWIVHLTLILTIFLSEEQLLMKTAKCKIFKELKTIWISKIRYRSDLTPPKCYRYRISIPGISIQNKTRPISSFLMLSRHHWPPKDSLLSREWYRTRRGRGINASGPVGIIPYRSYRSVYIHYSQSYKHLLCKSHISFTLHYQNRTMIVNTFIHYL